MKIRNRLTWIISLAALGAITALGLLIYISTSRFHEKEFFTRLEERVEITELILLEKDREIEQRIRDKFLQTLDEELEYAISMKPSGQDSIRSLFPAVVFDQVKNKEFVYFWFDSKQGVAKRYDLPQGEFVVVVVAEDTFGKRKLNFLRRILLIGGFFAVLLLVVVDRIGLVIAFRPLENKIHRASHIGADRLDLRLHVKNPNDEIGAVAIAFNRMLDRLQNSFEAQRAFVRNASHEMQNPLTAISGQLEVSLQKDRTEAEYKTTLEAVQQDTNRLKHLIGQLLLLEKTEAISILPNPEDFSLDQCLLESIEQFSSERIRMEFDIDTEDHMVRGNALLIQTALQNLLDNALKYSGNLPITVRFFEVEHGYQIDIIDQGIGIPEADLKRIFQPLYRSRNARTRNGHGIGLTLVKKIISLHKGQLDFSSIPNKGTTVCLFLPGKNAF